MSGEAGKRERTDELYERLSREAETSGYHLNPDIPFVRDLMTGLVTNLDRYGYLSCPCRLASGAKAEDLDIICPCDYRDPDLTDYGACYCALYVSRAVLEGRESLAPVPERRPGPEERKAAKTGAASEVPSSLPYPVWRCAVCGYLCAREEPPETCPICRASGERFEKFL